MIFMGKKEYGLYEKEEMLNKFGDNYLTCVSNIGKNYDYMILSFLLNKIPKLSKEIKILDIGTGNGKNAFQFIFRGYNNCYAIDLSTQNLKTFINRNIQFSKCDIEKQQLPFNDQTFDLIISSQTIEHLRNYSAFFGEANRVLKMGGYIIIDCPDWERSYDTFYSTYTHFTPFTKESLKQILAIYQFETIAVGNIGMPRWIFKIWDLIRIFKRNTNNTHKTNKIISFKEERFKKKKWFQVLFPRVILSTGETAYIIGKKKAHLE